MGFKQDLSFNQRAYAMADIAQKSYNNVQHIAKQVEQQLPGNRELLNKINQYGFQKL